MAARLGFDERSRIEAMRTAGVSVAVMARRLGRDPSTVHRELKRSGVGGRGPQGALVQDREASRCARDGRGGAGAAQAALVAPRRVGAASP